VSAWNVDCSSGERVSLVIRVATPADIPALQNLIPASARALSRDYYSDEEIEAAIRYVFGIDSRLIADQTYYVALDDVTIVGCGGWSWRRTLYGGDQRPIGGGAVLDPSRDAARIRAFFVASSHARQGIGARILATCEEAALKGGFSRVELMSTLPGVPFYSQRGFKEVEHVVDTLPDGTRIKFVRMSRSISSDSRSEATSP
jgi:N-acetylglutamate synthase-like GNAT family acetyltransferase